MYKFYLIIFAQIPLVFIHANRYNDERDHPELPRNMPPVAGRIMWIRFYDNNIKKPMQEFMKHHEVITHMVRHIFDHRLPFGL